MLLLFQLSWLPHGPWWKHSIVTYLTSLQTPEVFGYYLVTEKTTSLETKPYQAIYPITATSENRNAPMKQLNLLITGSLELQHTEARCFLGSNHPLLNPSLSSSLRTQRYVLSEWHSINQSQKGRQQFLNATASNSICTITFSWLKTWIVHSEYVSIERAFPPESVSWCVDDICADPWG